MNDIETGEVLDVIAAHYWQAVRKSEAEQTLMVATWVAVFTDIPREPHVNLALAEWFREEKWPPQASELRELALDLGGPTPRMVAEAERWRRDESERAIQAMTRQREGDLRVEAVRGWVASEAEQRGISPAMVRSDAGLGYGWEEWVRLGTPSQWRPEWTPYLDQLRERNETAVLERPELQGPLAVAIARRAS